MQSDNRFLDDLAKLATGAAGALTSARAEAEGALKAWLDRRLEELDLVPREEFEAAQETAVRAREQAEDLAERVAALEAELAKIRAGGRRTPARRGGNAAAKGRGGGGSGKGGGGSGTQ